MCHPLTEQGPRHGKEEAKKSNYRVRFRHGVYPDQEGSATREDIKKYDYFFGSAQEWVGMPTKVEFVDESAQIVEEMEGYAVDQPGSSKRLSQFMTRKKTVAELPQGASRRSAKISDLAIRAGNDTSNNLVPTLVASGETASSPWWIATHPHDWPGSFASESANSAEESLSSSWDTSLICTSPCSFHAHENGVKWPLADPVEAHLFRFWMEKAAAWWNITSPEKVFSDHAPILALNNPMLLNAIFMISAQHIVRFEPGFPARPYLYHDRILRHLIPYLSEKGRIEDEATLLVAILLRSFEEFHAGTKGQHLSTFELFVGPEGWHFDTSRPVVQACLMVHVHFDIYQSLLVTSQLRIDYEGFMLSSLRSPASDVAWANRIVWLCARILQWAEKDFRTVTEWQELTSLVDEWERDRPTSFNTFFRDEGFLIFNSVPSELWFISPCHAHANQQLRICRMALIAYQPVVGLTDVERDSIGKSMQQAVLKGLKELMAIARGNTQASSPSSIAAHAIHKFAVVLQDEADRTNTLEFLEEVNTLGWPTANTMDWLRNHWRGNEMNW